MPKKAKAKVKAKLKVKPKAKPVPPGLHTATPYLFVQGAAGAIDFYKAAFNAKELMRMPAPGGRVGHAQIRIGNSHIMLADEFRTWVPLDQKGSAVLRSCSTCT